MYIELELCPIADKHGVDADARQTSSDAVRINQHRWTRFAICTAGIVTLALLTACSNKTEMTAEDDAAQLGLKDYFCLVTPNECNREAYRKLWAD